MFQSRLEQRTREIGREIFHECNTARPSPLDAHWWDDRVMDWAMRDPVLEANLFHFVDVLPALSTADAVAGHIQAYFAANAKLPWALRTLSRRARPGSRFAKLAASIARSNTRRMARRFIAGETSAEVISSVASLWRSGFAFTLSRLGEATVTEAEAAHYLSENLDLLEAVSHTAPEWPANATLESGSLPRVNLSIKVSALYSQFDPIDPDGSFHGSAPRLREVFRAARRSGAFIHVDMEHYSFKDLTLHIFMRLLAEPEFRDWPDVGIAIQAYMPESELDLVRLLDWVRARGTPIWVRLVKGAYWDVETIVHRRENWPVPLFQQKWQSDACFERCTGFLFTHRQWLRPAFGTHNVRSIAHALALAELMDAAPASFEFQMIYGMAGPVKAALYRRRQRVRIYTPFGELIPGMAYLVRRLIENTSNSSFLRAMFADRKEAEELLRAPAESGHFYPLPEASMTQTDGMLPRFTNEPLADFTHEPPRLAMAAALASVRAQFGRSYPLWIAGESRETGQWLESRNPANNAELLGRVSKAGIADADRAVAAALAAFPAWSALSDWDRAAKLFDVARRMRSRKFELAAWIVFETGKQWRESDADVAEAIDFCEYYGREMLSLTTPRRRNLPGERNEYFYIPRGVTVVIAPWNFPLAILTGMAVAPLVGGNPVILKPAEQSSIVAAKLVEILRETGFDPGVVNFVPGLGEEVGKHLVEHPGVATITFTGSVAVGTAINLAASRQAPGQRHVKRVLAEMGGKNAIIIDNDADLDEAIRGVVASAFGYQGQKCSACSRVIVLDAVYEAFVSRLTGAVRSLTIGPPEAPAFTVGPVIDRDAFDRLNVAIARAKSEATLIASVDPGDLALTGNFIGPHVFADVDPESMLAQTELFGPVLAVIRAPDLTSALEIANGTAYALTGGCYSRNPATLERVRREFLVGNLYLNRRITGALVDCQPFGGFKLSGIGAKAGGPDYLRQFLMPRAITENTLRRGFAPGE
jgi:RHH-type proline utilization regulon transcriptional repressor/proline dehydrogenase/delta 1-pyrroline-5-carboxylate dehydrogenase